MRLLLLFFIGLTFGFGGGFLVGGGMGDSGHAHDHAGHSDAEHDHTTLVDWTGPVPEITLSLTADMGTARNLMIDAPGFTFTPETVNSEPTLGTGHAHIYINGDKVLRSYGPWVHLPTVQSGDIIRVTLNADNHAPWGNNGTPLAAEVTAP